MVRDTRSGWRVRARTVLFSGQDRKRRSIRLDKVSQRQAEAIKLRVERLVTVSGHPSDLETTRWVADLESSMAEKLARVGLIPAREAPTLMAFLDQYIASRTDDKPGTVMLYQQTRRNLLEFFDPLMRITAITPGDTDEWRLHLLQSGLNENTFLRHSGRAKQFFGRAIRKGLIQSNPFADLKSNVNANLAHAAATNHQASRSHSLAQALSKPAEYARN